MSITEYESFLLDGIKAVQDWQAHWPAFSEDETTQIDFQQFKAIFKTFTKRLQENYPYFHPLYAGQMLKPPHPVAVLGYLTAMLINPNNHALDSSEATSKMEKECIEAFGKLFGFQTPLGHLTGGGTTANLEALWVAKQLHPQQKIAFSDQAHYTHQRMCDLMGIETVKIASTPDGTMDLSNLEVHLQADNIGTVVATLGTTALGALDPLNDLVALKNQYGFRIHVDTAYGGFYSVLAKTDTAFSQYQAIAHCDSVVLDPHKQGLQPYGCGCVIFSDPGVGKCYKHDSPYTYFTSSELHLGEISLECSRSGAAAAALWLTLQCFPLEVNHGFGPILQKTRQAALTFAQHLQESPTFALFLPPQLDIVTYFPQAASTQAISDEAERIFKSAMASQNHPLYLALLKVNAEKFKALHPQIEVNSAEVNIFRSCLLKPEHAAAVPQILASLHHHAAQSVSLAGSH